jgi:hypothetical protein
MTEPDLIRFLDAQDQIYSQVIEELTNGRKQTHWMWFVFPQFAGLGRSGMGQHCVFFRPFVVFAKDRSSRLASSFFMLAMRCDYSAVPLAPHF